MLDVTNVADAACLKFFLCEEQEEEREVGRKSIFIIAGIVER